MMKEIYYNSRTNKNVIIWDVYDFFLSKQKGATVNGYRFSGYACDNDRLVFFVSQKYKDRLEFIGYL